MIDDNLQQLFAQPKDHRQLCQQVAALRSMVISLAQEVDALQKTLADGGNFDTDMFKSHRKKNMLEDHSSLGPHPWTAYSYYRFLLREEAYLREVLRLSPEEVSEFAAEITRIETLT